jgi:hypothetical protein
MADTWDTGSLPNNIQRVLPNRPGQTTSGQATLRDYTHASKIFRDNGNYQNTPKFKYLFHVYFKINSEAFPDAIANDYGVLVKSIKLPSFNIDTAIMNQYNRKRIVQTKIKYDPIDVTFHDDNGSGLGTPNLGGTIRALWKAYYNYYYFDGTTPEVVFSGNRGVGGTPVQGGGGTIIIPTEARYNERTQYKPSNTGNTDWGYIGENQNADGVKIPFFKNITIFGFNRHLFSAYTLINPIITRFTHDTYDYAQNTGIMENQMSIDYETVIYNEGAMDGEDPSNIVTGFGNETNYDRRKSTITPNGANSVAPGPYGLVQTNGGAVTSTTGAVVGYGYGNGSNNPSLAAYDSFKNTKPLNVAPSETVAGLSAGAEQPTTRNTQFSFPGSSQITAILGKAGMPPFSQLGAQQLGANPAGYQVPSYAQQQYGRNRNQSDINI